MKILFLNWRDWTNPRAGGAEVVTRELCTRWVKAGHEVTLFTAGYKGCKQDEELDGVKIIRRGRQWTVHFKAFMYYQKYLKGKVDLVIDEVNTIPFFTPLYVKEKKIVYFNQLAREVWFYESKFPISLFGYLLEPLYLLPYLFTKAMVISDSTKKDIAKYGIKKAAVFPMAIEFEKEQKYLRPKEKNLTLVFVGRLVRSKRPEELIRALSIIKKSEPNARVWFVGGGEESFINKLKVLVNNLSLRESVQFYGYVKEEEKYTLMSRATMIVVCSVKEGWGLIVTEANAVKTPAVVYDVDGLRDAVKNNLTGLVVAPNPNDLAQGILKMWNDPKLLQKFEENAFISSKNYSWEKTADIALAIVKNND